jgi:hypothetical protein
VTALPNGHLQAVRYSRHRLSERQKNPPNFSGLGDLSCSEGESEHVLSGREEYEIILHQDYKKRNKLPTGGGKAAIPASTWQKKPALKRGLLGVCIRALNLDTLTSAKRRHSPLPVLSCTGEQTKSGGSQ